AYLYTIARNLCMDHFRKRKGEENREEWKEDTEWRTEDFSKDLEKKFVLRQAMRSLEEKQQEVLFLRYVNEITVKETALFMGISRFAVYRLEKAALSALQQILRKEDFYE
ncbi:MAG: sigma-70 family RNA polymerase sigma factor, partial [Lachnospiraceae bacterium]|nr:sigma-70 family RNA polymerase sigma factor [Lachnospiraceae bacterium]